MKKALKIIVSILLVAVVVAFGVFYIVSPGQAQWTLENIMHFLNQPLPIIGCTFAAFLFFLYKCFIESKYGKGVINDLRRENEQLREDNANFKAEQEKLAETFKNGLKEKDKFIAHICELSTNVKIKNYGKEVLGHGEETTQRETNAD